MEGGTTVGQRSMFYVGIGHLFGDTELVALIKGLLRDSEQTVKVIDAELDELHRSLAHPLSKSKNNDKNT